MAAWVEATSREMGQSLINPDKPSDSASALPGDTEKPEIGPKAHLMPKPFSLQRNATVRSIRAPKTNFNRQLQRATSSDTLLNTTDTRAGGVETSDSNGTVNGSYQSAAPKPVPLRPKPDLQAKPKPELTKSPDITGSKNQTGPNSKPDVTAEDIKNVQHRSRAKSLGSQDQKILNPKAQGEAAVTEADVKVPSRCWPARNRLSMQLTSKFESPSQEVNIVRSKTEKEGPPRSPSAVSESKSSKPPVEKEEEGDEEVGGGSIKRRISLLFDRSAASQRRDTFNKKDITPAEISIDIKQRIQNLSLPSTGAPKSPPFEKTNERSSERPADSATEKDKPPNTTEIKNSGVENAEEKEDDGVEEDKENYVAVPVYQRVGISIDAEKKRKEEEEKQRKDEQLEKERRQQEKDRLLEEERKAKEIQKQQEEERKQEEEKQRQMEERKKQEEEWKRRLEEERKEEERRIQAEKERERQRERERLERERQIEEEKRRIEKERQREEERLRQEKLKKEKEMEEERRRIQELERQKEEERIRKEQERERIRKEKEMEEERRRIQEMERQKEEGRLRQEREKEERLKKEREMEEEKRRVQEMERQKEEERLRQEREKEERLKKEREMEEERRRVQEMERQKEEERLRKEQEMERIRKEKEMEEERLKEEERLRQQREKEERFKKEREMEEERRRIQEMERQKEEERLRKEQEMERIRKEKEMEEERQRIQEMERQKKEEKLRQEREKEERLKKEREMEEKRLKEEERLRQEREKEERLKKEREMEEERRRIQELERQKEEEKMRKEREMERIRKERDEERLKEEERLKQEREKEERLKKEREMEEERRRVQDMERQKEEERLRKEREMERIKKERETEERKRMEEQRQREEEERLRQEGERLKKEMEMEACKSVERLQEEVPTSYDLISFNEEEPAASPTLVSAVSPQLTEVIFDDFSVKPRRWGTGARRSSTPSPSREPLAASDHNLQPEAKSNDPGSQEPHEDQVNVDDLIGLKPEASSPQNSSYKHTESREQTSLSEEETESKPEDLLVSEIQSDEGQLKDCEPEEDGVSELDTENLIDEADEQTENNDTVDDVGTESRINLALQRLTQVRQRNKSTDSDRSDVPAEEEPEPLPVLESAAPLLDSSVFRSKVDLAKKRSIKRSRPTRAVRQRDALPALTEGTNPDWRFCDSTDAKDQRSNGGDSESEEEPSRDVTSPPAPSQPKRVPMFPGINPLALMAQFKRRSGVVEADSPPEAQTPPSVPTRSPRTPTMALGPRVLPPVDAKDSGSGSSPSWLLELKSKKRTSQPESEA